MKHLIFVEESLPLHFGSKLHIEISWDRIRIKKQVEGLAIYSIFMYILWVIHGNPSSSNGIICRILTQCTTETLWALLDMLSNAVDKNPVHLNNHGSVARLHRRLKYSWEDSLSIEAYRLLEDMWALGNGYHISCAMLYTP